MKHLLDHGFVFFTLFRCAKATLNLGAPCLRGGDPQCRAAGRAVCPLPEPPEGDGAPGLYLGPRVAVEALPHPVLDLAEGLMH